MEIRKYQPSDCEELAELFYNTVHIVNAKDYTKEQLDVWATGQVDLEKWNQAVQGNVYTHSSITARPFFEKRGYKIVKEQKVERQGVFLTNYVMVKETHAVIGSVGCSYYDDLQKRNTDRGNFYGKN